MKTPLLFILLMLFSNYGFSQWSNDPNVNTIVASGVNSYKEPRSFSDGTGGIVSCFARSVYDPVSSMDIRSLYVQKLSASGVSQWPGTGVQLSATTNNISAQLAVADGSGGIVAVWLEETVNGSEQTKIFAQRVDNAGNVMWGASGTVVAAIIKEYELGDLIRDAVGNYVFSFGDVTLQKNFAQKLNTSGVAQWGTGTQLVDPLAIGAHTSALANLDGAGYKFIWQEEYTIGSDEGARYYWQKINADGTRNGANFLIDDYVPNPTIKHGIEALAPDGSGGFYFITVGDNNLVAQLYLQHVLSDGTKAFNATAWGMEIDASIGKIVLEGAVNELRYGLSAVADGAGGVVVGWTDTRAASDGIYAQRFNSTGTKLWGASDLAVVSGFSIQNFYGEQIKRNEDGDFMFWINKPSATFGDYIYIQKVSAAGANQFGTAGVLTSSRDTYKYGDMVVSGNKVVLVWEEYPMGGGSNKIYSQAILSSGTLPGVLPVKFASFNAVYSNGSTKLNWSTATETNNDYFDVERSEDGVNFVVVGSEKGSMHSNQLKAYAFTDLNTFASGGFLYYRIKQVDKDGKFEYSDIMTVKVPTLALFAVKSYPNPVTNRLNISMGQHTIPATYLLNDSSGKVWVKGKFAKSHEIEVTQLPVGVYILNIKSGDQVHREKIIKN